MSVHELARTASPRAPLNLTFRQLALAPALLALLAGCHRASPPAPPYPEQISAVDYAGPVTENAAGDREFALRISATATGAGSFDVLAIQQHYPGVTLTSAPASAVAVAPGHPAVFVLTYRVTDCAAVPLDAQQPFLDVTLRNKRAVQTISEILGGEYASELSKDLRAACRSADIRTSPPASVAPDGGVR